MKMNYRYHESVLMTMKFFNEVSLSVNFKAYTERIMTNFDNIT